MSHAQLVRHCSRLGLLAMLLLLVGPLLGQGLNQDGGEPSWYNELACSSEHEKSPSVDHGDWAKCGYCTLLLGSPAVPGSAPQASPCLTPSPLGVLPTPLLANRGSVFPGALTRAPPIS